MTSLIKTVLLSALVVFVSLVSAHETKADPLFFSNVVALQNGGTSKVDLFSNPGVNLYGSSLSFMVDITGTLPPGVGDSIQLTYLEFGQAPIVHTYAIPLFGTINPPFSLLVTFASPGANPFGVNARLIVDLLGSTSDFVLPGGPNSGQRVDSYTYTFRVTEVPEPTSLILLGTGFLGVAGSLRRHWSR